ncbi:MAG: hypothetical protein P0116_10210 [Candidatus Nitrosocosmicus sp.]|nr:hypothetical protein [Candidatus Nitrosocosmicus sp.]
MEWKDRVAILVIDSIRDLSILGSKADIILGQGNDPINSEFDYDVNNSSLDENARITEKENGRKNRSRTATNDRGCFYDFIGGLYRFFA